MVCVDSQFKGMDDDPVGELPVGEVKEAGTWGSYSHCILSYEEDNRKLALYSL